MMRGRRFWLAALIIAAILVAGFALSVPRVRELDEPARIESAAASSTPAVTFKDAYKKGVHTIKGSVTAPDACSSANASASSTDTGIALDIALTPSAGGICLEAPTAMPFSVSISAPKGAIIDVRVNGAEATTTP